MGPKVEAACRFADDGGRAIITHLSRIGEALAGRAGTMVTHDVRPAVRESCRDHASMARSASSAEQCQLSSVD